MNPPYTIEYLSNYSESSNCSQNRDLYVVARDRHLRLPRTLDVVELVTNEEDTITPFNTPYTFSLSFERK